MTTTLVQMRRAGRGDYFRALMLHGADPSQLDPFLGIDQGWMSAPTFPPHPHAGFSAVTYMFLDSETGIDNRDSIGNNVLIEPGGLHWTAAGRGVVHQEDPAELGRTTHLLQIFVNLPQEKQNDPPFALTLAPQDVPVAHLPGATVRVPLGSFGGLRSPLTPPTDITLLDVSLEEGASFTLPLPAGQRALIMPVAGSLGLDGQRFGGGELRAPVIGPVPVATSHQVLALEGGAQFAVFVGQPLEQPVISNGPMAFANRASLEAAVAAYQRGELGQL